VKRFLLLPILALSACGATNVEYTRIGYGPDLKVAKAQCDIGAMGVDRDVIAIGNSDFVGGAVLGNAISDAVRKRRYMKDCMIINGWEEVPSATSVSASSVPPGSPHASSAVAKPKSGCRKYDIVSQTFEPCH
jgi:hypothetical protein